MARIWFEGDGRILRDRRGKKFVRKFLCVEAHGMKLCGRKLSNKTHTFEFARSATTSPIFLFALLLSPYWLSREELISFRWPNPEDEPENAEDTLDVQISNLRKILKPFGLSIACRYKFGYIICTLNEFMADWNHSRRNGTQISNWSPK